MPITSKHRLRLKLGGFTYSFLELCPFIDKKKHCLLYFVSVPLVEFTSNKCYETYTLLYTLLIT